jgi:hypothetical protein
MEILRRAQQQAPGPDGIRRTRWAIIRNSYPELKTTTLKTWMEWCPREYGKLTMDSPITHYVKTTELDMEVLFLALDREDDQRKLLSLELTGAWLNEAREIPKAILDALSGRVGRYPSKSAGGPAWWGILMDTNAPTDDHWWKKLADEPPENFQFFHQPSGLAPDAENIQHLPKDYYKQACAGKDPEWVKVYVEGEYGYLIEGKVVYPMYRDSIHTSPVPIEPVKDIALTIGVDFGLTPAAVIGQKLVDGRWLILDEITTENCGVSRFGQILAKYMAQNYPEHVIACVYGDPAGNARDGDEKTALDLLRQHSGYRVKAAPNNDLTMRLECVKGALNRLVDGRPGFFLSPKCKMLRKGFSSGYHYKSVKTGNGSTYHDAPAKNEYSHPHDALQYLLLGGGEADIVLNRVKRARGSGPTMARDVDYSIFGD